jgi:hypothetical protein
MTSKPSRVVPAAKSAPREPASMRRQAAARRQSNVPDDSLPAVRRAAPKICRLRRRELAVLAREAWAFRHRKPGAENPFRAARPEGRHLKSISVIEISNDDMPFLGRSVMGE